MAPPVAVEIKADSDTSAIVIPDPLTIGNVAKSRTAAGKLIAGVAAPTHSSRFKANRHEHKPKAKRWDHHLSKESSSRQGNSLKNAAQYLSRPGLISLGGGLPSSEYFPFDSLTVKVPTPGSWSEAETRSNGTVLTSGKYDLYQDISAYDICTAFNYGQGSGSAQILRFITEHTEIVHQPPYADWGCTMTVGSTSALEMCLRMLTQRGDMIVSEDYTYSTGVEAAAPMGVKVAGVSMDEQGLLPTGLDEVLSGWDEVTRGAKKPTVLYTVPTGQNPTGATQGVERRKEIYKVAQKHDLIILEDEPYYFLQMQPYTGQGQPDAPPPKNREEFLKSLVPSLLSMDTDGRVMRLDSFSKVIAPGSRLGWVTASEQLVERFTKHADVSTQGSSGASQLILFKLLDEHWDHGGYLDWLMYIRLEYTKRRDVILGACEKHLPRDLVSWVPPAAGMFHWLKVDYKKHPHYAQKTLLDLEDEIFMTVIDHGALVMKGSYFYADASEQHDTMFFRTTFCAAPSDKIEEAIRRFGEAIRESFGVTEDGANGNGHAVDG
ncbi:MAG: Aromatic/aminoadipate aminotransferase 1 [Bogoriella megaspora]|nr:MAG: Aromatic/aminoadipate aminotransferase 1 [Bogoriella megaspora]